MKNAKLFLWLSALAVLALSLSWEQPFAVAQQDGDPAAPTAQQPEQSQQPYSSMDQQSDVKTFTGKIMKSGDEFVLQDSIGESSYQLDDQRQAKGFEGKSVKVTGAVDPVTKTIHIAKIEAKQ
jgi:uncharacterized protein DUF5818